MKYTISITSIQYPTTLFTELQGSESASTALPKNMRNAKGP